MDKQHPKTPWLERVEDLIHVLEGSTVSELELTEAGTEIIIRRRPDMVMVSAPVQHISTGQVTAPIGRVASAPAPKQETGLAVKAPLTGVYYPSPSPTSPPFVSVGDIIQVGQIVALVEAMKVFNEIQSEVSGRVTKLVATSGEVVQKGETILLVEPL